MPSASHRHGRTASSCAQADDQQSPASPDNGDNELFTSADADEAACLEAQHLGAFEEAEEGVPQSLFAHRQISDPTAMNAQPVALKTAMK